MAESSLSLKLADLGREVGRYLGYGRDETKWGGWQTTNEWVASGQNTQLQDVLVCLNAGLRQFYFPARLPGDAIAHRWSFLTPTRELATVKDVWEYDLPDDFAAFDGPMSFASADTAAYQVELTGESELLRQRQTTDGLIGKPRLMAQREKRTQGVLGQRFSVLMFPTPDAAYVLSYPSILLPGALTAVNQYPYGTMAHGQTLMQSCLAAAESWLNDEKGQHYQAFLERLVASVDHDRSLQPALLGYNGDGPRRWRGRGRAWHDQAGLYVTFGGVKY